MHKFFFVKFSPRSNLAGREVGRWVQCLKGVLLKAVAQAFQPASSRSFPASSFKYPIFPAELGTGKSPKPADRNVCATISRQKVFEQHALKMRPERSTSENFLHFVLRVVFSLVIFCEHFAGT